MNIAEKSVGIYISYGLVCKSYLDRIEGMVYNIGQFYHSE